MSAHTPLPSVEEARKWLVDGASAYAIDADEEEAMRAYVGMRADKLIAAVRAEEQAKVVRETRVTLAKGEYIDEYVAHHWTCSSTHDTGLPCDCAYPRITAALSRLTTPPTTEGTLE